MLANHATKVCNITLQLKFSNPPQFFGLLGVSNISDFWREAKCSNVTLEDFKLAWKRQVDVADSPNFGLAHLR